MWSSPSWVSQVLSPGPHPESLSHSLLLSCQQRDVESALIISFQKFSEGSSTTLRSLVEKNSMFVE